MLSAQEMCVGFQRRCFNADHAGMTIILYHTIKRTAEQGQWPDVKENSKKYNFFEISS